MRRSLSASPLVLLVWVALGLITVMNMMDAFEILRFCFRSSVISTRNYCECLSCPPKVFLFPCTIAYIGNDVPAELPGHFQSASLIVHSSDVYNLTADVEWASLVPKGGGWVRLGPNGREFAVSQYHQYRCLDAIREVYVAGRDQTKSKEELAAGFDRADHCFDYLRQMLMCGADIAVEWQVPGTLATTGNGVLHKCRDWTQVRKAVEENYELWGSK
jgi:hypothetical protein